MAGNALFGLIAAPAICVGPQRPRVGPRRSLSDPALLSAPALCIRPRRLCVAGALCQALCRASALCVRPRRSVSGRVGPTPGVRLRRFSALCIVQSRAQSRVTPPEPRATHRATHPAAGPQLRAACHPLVRAPSSEPFFPEENPKLYCFGKTFEINHRTIRTSNKEAKQNQSSPVGM